MTTYKSPSALLSVILLMVSTSTMAALDVNAVWNYDDPAASEARFRELKKSAGPDDAAILETQIARTYGLRSHFDEARDILSNLKPQLPQLGAEARVRYHLEYGRTLISPVHKKAQKTDEAKTAARNAYLTAYELAKQNNLDYLAVDALHMLPFVDTEVESSLKWTKLALDTTVQSTQPATKQWEPMLRNNYGYYLRNQGKLQEALAAFQENLPVTEKAGNVTKTRIAYWMVAWTLRSLGRLDEALTIQQRLESENARDSTPDQYVFEELAHIFKAKGEAAKAAHYEKLHEAQVRAAAK